MIASKTCKLIGGGWFARVCRLIAGLGAVLAVPAFADWTEIPEPIATHETWIYTPNAPMPGSARHGLLVVLHGCDQDPEQLKTFGNLTGAADRNGLVLALPKVGLFDQWRSPTHPFIRPECWDYDRALDKRAHVPEITSLARTLINRADLRIDADHVYVVGLSSGGALSLLLGCAAPDVFAGVGAIAGPSVGSNEDDASEPGSSISSTNIEDAIRICTNLAEQKDPACLDTQIANIAYGDMDEDGHGCCEWWRPGQYPFVSIEWSKQNVEILRRLYALPRDGQEIALAGAEATEWSAGQRARLAEIKVYNVGHAWPSGKEDFGGGLWIARHGLDYPSYIADWFERHNVRAGQPGCHS
jgi:poly(3-hydroxybutyrate) depolymerase